MGATGKGQQLAFIPAERLTDEELMDNVKKLGSLFSEMVENSNDFGATWKNIPIGHDAFALMRDSLPLRVKGELTPYTRIVLLNKMMECMPERDCARFLKEVKEYQLALFPLIGPEDLAEDMDIDGFEGAPAGYVRSYSIEDHRQGMQRIMDYLDAKLSMEDWCDRYDVHLKFDPVERTVEWENCIYKVEKECDKILRNERKGMGFCYSYWSTKKAVLARYGIEWDSPSTMNPHVMFD